jgi:cellulose synthase/poly-beta-1,6-N-acetylglucosamine synthase-like glycosyltransferase
MVSSLDLLQSILKEDRLSTDAALGILQDALLLEIDIIDYCVKRLRVPQALAFARAAQWAGLVYEAAVPRYIQPAPAPARIDALAEVRGVSVSEPGRDLVYLSPGFREFIGLHDYALRDPAAAARIRIVPPQALHDYIASAHAPHLMQNARQRLARRWPHASAHLDLPLRARIAFVVMVLVLIAATVIAPFTGNPVLIAIAILIVAAPAMIRLLAIRVAPRAGTRPVRRPPDSELPIYSVLLPLRDEAGMVAQLYQAISALDYPPEKLDVKFVVEGDCAATIEAVKPYLRDHRFELVEVPPARPRTKPKAMNYALPLVRGKHVVIFDAEDRPARDQLWRAAQRFGQTPEIACLQAELFVDNGGASARSALFAGEYAALFGIVLPALARWNLPVPLGGTSNHFRSEVLRSAGGWDSFNVTEDADLGVRLARLGYRVETLASHTLEEAPDTLPAWMAQRTRWIKGWMQTFIVHNRQPLRLARELGWKGFIFFELIILGMILAPMLHVVFLATAGFHLAAGDPLASVDSRLWTLGYFVLFLLGSVAAFVVNAAGLRRLERHGLIIWQLALPYYWLLLAAATVRALHELLVKPFHWAKTSHRPVAERRRKARASSMQSTETGDG